ncbi:hypothetical protein P3102_00820 [Amycolatopsis sp. QT-25]|uniref:hypothetical protein n=1 Tax=Amycolatopsis sp. QT-25 TaxID=3034022 RepID=UPI0023ECCDDE|nr:hypothetical protein [Amycolatopsis sp. QT-25]WET79834.1 hypothetical protein P3102_00820 [Amycolatopsis sp. QT-25]
MRRTSREGRFTRFPRRRWRGHPRRDGRPVQHRRGTSASASGGGPGRRERRRLGRRRGRPGGGRALPDSFVYGPFWFTDLGPSVRVEQRYADGNPLVAGHWRTRDDGTGGPLQAAGQAAVVSGTSGLGGRAVLFGTEPLFRDHPKGLYSQVARAVYRAAAK